MKFYVLLLVEKKYVTCVGRLNAFFFNSLPKLNQAVDESEGSHMSQLDLGSHDSRYVDKGAYYGRGELEVDQTVTLVASGVIEGHHDKTDVTVSPIFQIYRIL